MPRTLAIDCATEACSVALIAADNTVIAGDWRLLARGHAEALVPMIAALPDKGRAAQIAVALGPGSFTGLRVGLAAARALALAWNAELVGYPTLALVAAQALTERPAARLTVAMRGGHGEWFCGEFDGAGVPLGEVASLSPEAAIASASDQVAGSAAEALVAARGWGSALPLWSDARALPLLDPARITPDAALLYGRPPDARLPPSAAAGSEA